MIETIAQARAITIKKIEAGKLSANSPQTLYKKDGKPYATEAAAKAARKKHGYSCATRIMETFGGGYAIVPSRVDSFNPRFLPKAVLRFLKREGITPGTFMYEMRKEGLV